MKNLIRTKIENQTKIGQRRKQKKLARSGLYTEKVKNAPSLIGNDHHG